MEYLLDLCFAPGRQALSSYQLRNDVEPIRALCLTARDETGALVGVIRYWPICAGGAPALLLGPVAVHPTQQGMGLGSELIHRSLKIAKASGWTRVILIGDAPYYERYGFARENTLALSFPPPTNPDRFLGLALVDGAFDGLSGDVTRYISKDCGVKDAR